MVTSVLERETITRHDAYWHVLNLPILEKVSTIPTNDSDTIPISEIFKGYQGEGQSVGIQQVFIRVQGCNFWEEGHPCKWNNNCIESLCDTAYAGHVKDANEWLTIDEIVKRVVLLKCPNVFLTGGEVFTCKLTKPLVECLYNSGITNIEIQTNNSFPIPVWNLSYVKFSVDIKTPSSGNVMHNIFNNLLAINENDQIKFIIASKGDFQYSVAVINHYKPCSQIFFQPAYNILEPKELIKWMLELNDSHIRLSLQQQKWIYGTTVKGV